MGTSVLATCPPGVLRYKEFCKNGATKLYMPLYSEAELLTIGQHMRQQPDFPADMIELYSDESIRDRYAEYGGIIRHVLPQNQVYLEQLAFEKVRAMGDIDWRKHLASPNIEKDSISDLVVQYKIDAPHFGELGFAFVNRNVESQARAYLENLNVRDMLFVLRNMRSMNALKFPSRAIFEDLVARYVVEGATPLFRRALRASSRDDTRFAPQLAALVETEVVSFDDMKMRTLYKPKMENFSFVDFYFKDRIEEDKPDDDFVVVEQGGLHVPVRNLKFVAVNACSGSREPSREYKWKTFRSLKKALGLPDQLLVDFLFCPDPEEEEASVTKPTVNNIPTGTVLTTSILVVPDFNI